MYQYNLGLYFIDVLKVNSEQVALIYENYSLSYSELGTYVDSLSSLLLESKCERGDVIAIANTKQPLSYALMLASLRLGITYVNIDTDSPVSRINKILEVSKPVLFFYDDKDFMSVANEISKVSYQKTQLLDEKHLIKTSTKELKEQKNLTKLVDGDSIAYIMFTSGSTGSPKGVAVTHQNVIHLIEWGRDFFKISYKDNFANVSPMYFDNSVFDFYVGLFSGASLTPIFKNLLTDPYSITNYVERFKCTIWFSVPSLLIYLVSMKAIVPKQLMNLRLIIFGGEGYPKAELVKLYDKLKEHVVFVNVYGPTECTCICSAYEISDNDFLNLDGIPMLGNLNQNFDYKIINSEGKNSQKGELCLIGPNVAAGYYNDPVLTGKAFKTLFEKKHYMKRMYHTGDIVKKVNNFLTFVGRKDNQIKHMGYRIELEEIEHALVKLPEVYQSAVIYHRKKEAYGKIVAFVACSASNIEKTILEQLSNFLPKYMIPNKLVIMDKLIKNANGKVDRKILKDLLIKNSPN
jgi:D-alanine--poly(phosphoribitol) ligase subunit 1